MKATHTRTNDVTDSEASRPYVKNDVDFSILFMGLVVFIILGVIM